ncbi:hypothetical protein BCON_0221g00060 [Botryotinia convoluta]|uniref:Uncharacterized protein n=1 Tax=Botryotinia convoluta TaxID=54673 RepID=A0A4Z1HJV3_9HELO|nr:hypothetical protein BCON_0221g00060 [Botryotinia convoluta]
MDGGLCLCNICCTEDASETSESSPPQSPAQNTKQRKEELDEEYNQWCTSLIETEEYGERLKQTLDQGYEFSEDKFRKVEKKKFGRISDDEYEVMGTEFEEMEERVGEGFECCMKCMLTGELGSGSCGECEIDDDNNDLRGVESVEQEDEYQDIGDDDWECSAEESEAAMFEYEELVAALQRRYDPGQNRAATGVSIKMREDSPALEISMRLITATKPKTKKTSRWSSRTKATSSLSGFPNMETDMHIPRNSLQTIPSLSSNMSPDEGLESRSIHFPAKLLEYQRMTMQDNFIKSLISKLTKERREKKLVLRGSRRYRYLATVKRVMDSGWVVHSQVLEKFKRGRKRKLDEQSETCHAALDDSLHFP